MAWTYSGDPASTPRDKVRFLVGDTDTDNQLINDAEIAFLIAEWGTDYYFVAIQACHAIAGKFQAKSDGSKSVGDLSISTQYQAQAKGFIERAQNIQNQITKNSPPSPNFDTATFNGDYAFEVNMDTNYGNAPTSVTDL